MNKIILITDVGTPPNSTKYCMLGPKWLFVKVGMHSVYSIFLLLHTKSRQIGMA